MVSSIPDIEGKELHDEIGTLSLYHKAMNALHFVFVI
jgi:hypothetical protein